MLILGLGVGTLLGMIIASLFAVNASERGREDADELQDAYAREVEREEKVIASAT